jgi:PGF-pre-PGF domain-containing protein
MKKILIATLICLFIIPFVNAQQTCTISVEDPIYDSTTADVGATRTVSVTAKCSASSATASLSLVTSKETGTGTLTGVTDTGASQYESVSITTTGVTKTFTISASGVGSYSFYVKATTSDGGGAQSSTQYIQYVDPSSFVMTVDEDPSGTYASNTQVGVVITVHNLLTTSQTRNITLWFSNPSTTKDAGDPQSRLVTLKGGESTQLIWNITPVFASPTSAYVRLGDNSQATTLTFNQQTSGNGDGDGSSGGGGGGGGGGAAANKTHKKTQFWTKITPGAATIMKITDSEIGFKQINITVNNPAQSVKITVTKLDGKPASVTHEVTGKTYKYIQVDAENINETHLDKVKIQFEVNKSWINANNIDPDTIDLHRYRVNAWERLQTRKTSEDNDFIYYEAETPGFSTFAIVGEVKAEATTTTIPGLTTTTPGVTTTMPISEAGMGVSPWLIVVVVIIIAGVVGFWLYKRGLPIK